MKFETKRFGIYWNWSLSIDHGSTFLKYIRWSDTYNFTIIWSLIHSNGYVICLLLLICIYFHTCDMCRLLYPYMNKYINDPKTIISGPWKDKNLKRNQKTNVFHLMLKWLWWRRLCNVVFNFLILINI